MTSEQTEKILQSCDVFLAVYSKNFAKDPKCALEIGFAMLMDRPIYVVASEDEEIPTNLLDVAKHVVRYKKTPSGLQDACARISHLIAMERH